MRFRIFHRSLPFLLACIVVCMPPARAQQKLSLADALHAGLLNAPEARAAGDRVALQQAQVTGAKLRPNPRLYLQSEDLRPWADGFSFADNTEDYGYVQQTFELDGKRGKRIAFASTGVERSEAERTLALRGIAAGIADAYWTVAAAREALHEWQRELDDYDRLVAYQKSRVDAGATAGVDLLRTEVERDRAALSYGQAERDAEDAALTLARLTATPGFRTAELADPLEAEHAVPEVALPTAVDERPDVIAARAGARESEAGLRLQRSYGASNIDFLGGYKRNSGFNTAYGALQYDLPFFNRNQGGIAGAAAQRQLAEDQLAYTRLQASTEIEIALNDYRREQAAVRTVLPPTVERAGRNAQILLDAYRSGGTDLLRLLDAQRVFIETRLLAIQTWTRYQRAAIALRLAYGEEP